MKAMKKIASVVITAGRIFSRSAQVALTTYAAVKVADTVTEKTNPALGCAAGAGAAVGTYYAYGVVEDATIETVDKITEKIKDAKAKAAAKKAEAAKASAKADEVAAVAKNDNTEPVDDDFCEEEED
jgi:microsomal dipeptidase-like Zn-dependent dipeptidase